jgi:hypothetical protein
MYAYYSHPFETVILTTHPLMTHYLHTQQLEQQAEADKSTISQLTKQVATVTADRGILAGTVTELTLEVIRLYYTLVFASCAIRSV